MANSHYTWCVYFTGNGSAEKRRKVALMASKLLEHKFCRRRWYRKKGKICNVNGVLSKFEQRIVKGCVRSPSVGYFVGEERKSLKYCIALLFLHVINLGELIRFGLLVREKKIKAYNLLRDC